MAKTSSRTDSSRSEIRELRTGETNRKKSRRSSDRCGEEERKGQNASKSGGKRGTRRTVETMAERTLAALRLTFQVASSSSSYLQMKGQDGQAERENPDATRHDSLLLKLLIVLVLILSVLHLLVVLIVSSVVLQSKTKVSERLRDR